MLPKMVGDFVVLDIEL